MTMTPGEVVTLTPLVRRVLAPNPSAFTGPGTNTYLIGTDELAVIDPGPDDHEEHLDKVAEAGAGRIRWILVTHTHIDHSPGAAGLKKRTGAVVMGFDERDGFVPDERLGEGSSIEAHDFRLDAMHTPGHASNHLCYRLDQERLVFSGDHIMSGSTVVIHPPDGDMKAYLEALDRLQQTDMAAIAPGHGEWIDDPHAKVAEYVAHRLAREAQIAGALERLGKARIKKIVSEVYTDTPPQLHKIARWSVWAHLRKLEAEGQVRGPWRPNKLKGVWRSEPSTLAG